MKPGETVTLDTLRRDIEQSCARLAKSGTASPLPMGTWLLIRALDARMNSNTIVATVPSFAPGADPAEAFALWLDAGAPGLAKAARDCDWEGHFEEVRDGKPPALAPLEPSQFMSAIDALLTTSTTFYGITIEEPESVRDAFVAAELEGGPAMWQFFSVNVSDLDPRVEYFDHLGNDHCLLWCNEALMRVLFTNGSD